MDYKRGERDRRYSIIHLVQNLTVARIFFIWIFMIVLFAATYFVLAFNPANSLVYLEEKITLDFHGFLNALYYSFITVTTTGYGDIYPGGLSKVFAVIEVMFGVIIQGLLIAKLVGFKQEAILEEIYNINYEEAFTNFRRGLALVRTDIVMVMEKVENKTIKAREIKDLWIIFSGLDQSLTNIRDFVIPSKKDNSYRKVDISKVELILNSMKLTMHKVLELIRVLKSHNLEWRDELLLTSAYYDVQICREIVDYETKRSLDRKVIDKINALRIIIDEVEQELKTPHSLEKNHEIGELKIDDSTFKKDYDESFKREVSAKLGDAQGEQKKQEPHEELPSFFRNEDLKDDAAAKEKPKDEP